MPSSAPGRFDHFAFRILKFDFDWSANAVLSSGPRQKRSANRRVINCNFATDVSVPEITSYNFVLAPVQHCSNLTEWFSVLKLYGLNIVPTIYFRPKRVTLLINLPKNSNCQNVHTTKEISNQPPHYKPYRTVKTKYLTSYESYSFRGKKIAQCLISLLVCLLVLRVRYVFLVCEPGYLYRVNF